MNVLVKLRALSAENAVPVLHAKGDAGEAVMLGDGDIDDLVGLEERLKNGLVLQEVAAKVNLFKAG